MILTNLLLILSLSIVGNTVLNLVTTKKQHLFHSTAILLAIAVLSHSNHISVLTAPNSISPEAIARFVSKNRL